MYWTAGWSAITSAAVGMVGMSATFLGVFVTQKFTEQRETRSADRTRSEQLEDAQRAAVVDLIALVPALREDLTEMVNNAKTPPGPGMDALATK
jgi:hypothetical protein